MLHQVKLEIHQREKEGIVILDIHGKLEIGNGDITLRDFVEDLLAQGNRRLILNLEHVSGIDTAGAGVLLLLAQRYREEQGKMVLFHVDRVHAKIYEMTRLEAVMEAYPNEIDAVNSFFPDRTPPHYDILEYVESQRGQNDQR